MNIFAQHWTFWHPHWARQQGKIRYNIFRTEYWGINTKLVMSMIPSLWGVNDWLQVSAHYF